MPRATPKLLNLNHNYPSRKVILLVKPLWNWGYDNSSQRNVRVSKLYSHDHIYNMSNIINFVAGIIDRNYDVITFILKYLYFKKTEQLFFLTSSKLQPYLLKLFLKTQKKLKELDIMYQNAIYICISWYGKICWFLLKQLWFQQYSKSVLRHIFFGSSLHKV